MTYQFDTDIATMYGVDEAIVIAHLQFWIKKNEANDKHFHEGRFWTYNSLEAFTKQFPFWKTHRIRRILKSLEEKGVIMTGNYNSSMRDRTTWYAFSDTFLEKSSFLTEPNKNGKCILENPQMHVTETANACDENRKSYNSSILYNNTITDNKPDRRTQIAAEGGTHTPTREEKESVKVTRPRRTAEKGSILFADSRYSDFEVFKQEFNGPEFQDVDLVYYFHAVGDWSAQKGKKMKDWIATARNFIRRDMDEGKVHKVVKNPMGMMSPAMEYLQSTISDVWKE